jgi:hypothetical protein
MMGTGTLTGGRKSSEQEFGEMGATMHIQTYAIEHFGLHTQAVPRRSRLL